ncbi:MAG: DUF4406 domain-containing protein [Opitutaceae bacterium]|jgi:hypothetical protein|nr:DUF4406 domain-containing protein [Opitutaceae bacterium]
MISTDTAVRRDCFAPSNPYAGWRINDTYAPLGTCYLSGPMTGTDNYVRAFAHAEELALSQGAKYVVNPAHNQSVTRHLRKDSYLRREEITAPEYALFLAQDMAALALCDSILMLPGWKASRGATAEHAYSVARGMRVLHIIDGEGEAT